MEIFLGKPISFVVDFVKKFVTNTLYVNGIIIINYQ